MMETMEAKAFPTDSSRMFSDGLLTQTTAEQQEVEKLVENERQKIRADSTSSLCRQQHIGYILNGLQHLSHSCMSMDSSRAWFCFWGVHSLNLLEARPEKELAKRIVTFLRTCRTPEGGYAGAPSQLAHLATTYASIMTLASIGTEEALASIDRAALWNFLASMRQQNGSFFIHRGGETDVRAAYCALAVAHLCRLPALDELFQGTATWLTRCQTYEGGFGGEPNCEAHGGYTFCALAGLALLQKIHLVNVEMAQRWLANRQMIFEGGFQGRTNKLVDVCYSYWQSASFSALESQQQQQIGGKQHHNLFNTAALQSYILDVCQEKNSGGFRDKPEKHTDLYHTCYALSGLSIAQSYARKEGNILGGEAVTLEPIHPLFNITLSAYERAFAYFDSADIDPQK